MPLDIQLFGKLNFVGYISLFYETWLVHFALIYLVVHLVSIECFMQILHCFLSLLSVLTN